LSGLGAVIAVMGGLRPTVRHGIWLERGATPCASSPWKSSLSPARWRGPTTESTVLQERQSASMARIGVLEAPMPVFMRLRREPPRLTDSATS